MRFFVATVFLLSVGFIYAQDEHHDHLPCLVNIQAQKAYQEHPDLKIQDSIDAAAFEVRYQNYLANEFDPFSRSSYVIPVVFHVVHEGGVENISDEQILDALAKLNEDYSMTNTDLSAVIPAFQGVIGNPDIEFRLATKDPSGNCHPGITRTFSPYTFDDGSGQTMNAVAGAHGTWPQNKYLNIFVVSDPNGAAGYTNYPAGWYSPTSMEGSIYLRHDYCGTIGTGSVSTRRTISHECAHWLNIQHVWGNSNNAGDVGNCSSDDQVGDTPNTLGNNGCNTATQTCGDLDNVQNNMDYTGSCRRMFTQGQVARMQTALNSNTADRDNLWTNANLIATGTNGPGELCLAEFSSDLRVVCAGQTIQFFDDSYHGITSRTWTFDGGSPGTSTAQNPIITFPNGGVYDVSLLVSDGVSTLTSTLQDYVVVQDDPGVALPYSEGFENLTVLPDNSTWSIENENGGAAWALVSTGASGSSKCTGLNNFGNTDGTSDELMSGTIDLSGVALSDPIVFDFEYAYRKRTASNNESLKFYISKDCGETWVLRKNISDETLSPLTATSSFVPQNAAEWYSATVTNINSDYYVSNFKFKFVFQNNGGNNIYIDNINLYPESMTGIVHAEKELGISVFPNPVNDLMHLNFNVHEAGLYQIDMVDALGRNCGAIYKGFLEAGAVNLEQSVKHLPAGIYFVKVLTDMGLTTVKFVKD